MGMSSGSGGRHSRMHDTPFTDINVTPFVDVMLVLLVIFMVTAPMMTSGVTVDLPESAAKPIPGNDEPLTISIRANGKIYPQESEIKFTELQARLAAIGEQKKDTRIFVRGDKAVDYGQIMKVVGEVNAAGLTKVGLLTDVASATTPHKP